LSKGMVDMSVDSADLAREIRPENTSGTSESDGQNGTGTLDARQKEKAKRERSSIAFPYNDLEDALEVARAIHAHAGAGDCDDTQLSAWMNLSAKSSGYRMKLTAARMFGVLDPSSERRKLTALGRAIVDPRQERAAKADAFLRVPLYAAIYERYKDTVLPKEEKTLEAEIVGLGVAEKQKVSARQVFTRSAQQAGYFEHGKNRLIRPGVAPPAREVESDLGNDVSQSGPGGGGGSGGGGDDQSRHPLIEGMFQSLPPKGDTWTLDEAADWLHAAAYNLRFAYRLRGKITIDIKVEQSDK
jgi:hypothetical protein